MSNKESGAAKQNLTAGKGWLVIVDSDNMFFSHSKYKVLESMLEDTLKRSVEVREEKIASLESRLTESVNRNKELRKQLMEVGNRVFSVYSHILSFRFISPHVVFKDFRF